MNVKKFVLLAALFMISILGVSFADGEDYVITIKDHMFSPAELVIPADKKVKIIIENHDVTVEEFESFDLNREKVVSGNGKIIIFVGPLKPGRYKYFGDFHQDTAQGIIVAQ